MKRNYTLVLKGHIALAKAVFPQGTTGTHIDILARLPLWRVGLNFRHGTGHGIGYALCVHEGPQNISQRWNAVALAPGMMLSNEPAMYADGEYGIRIENILSVKEMFKTEYGTFLGFEPLTRCPIDTRPVDMELLTADERDYLNDYHKTTYEALAPHLNEAEKAWLKEATAEVR
jgi:Xaa-Pro aminopeptidase